MEGITKSCKAGMEEVHDAFATALGGGVLGGACVGISGVECFQTDQEEGPDGQDVRGGRAVKGRGIISGPVEAHEPKTKADVVLERTGVCGGRSGGSDSSSEPCGRGGLKGGVGKVGPIGGDDGGVIVNAQGAGVGAEGDVPTRGVRVSRARTGNGGRRGRRGSGEGCRGRGRGRKQEGQGGRGWDEGRGSGGCRESPEGGGSG